MKTLLVAVALLFLLSGAKAQSAPIGIAIQNWHYDKTKPGQELSIDLLNTSHKDVTAFAIRIITSYADGTSNASDNSVDLLPGIISQKEHPDGPQEATFAPGAVYQFTTHDSKAIEHVDATMQLVAYIDGTADVQNQHSLDSLIATRQGTISGLRLANEIISKVLADPNEKHPSVQNSTKHRLSIASIATTAWALALRTAWFEMLFTQMNGNFCRDF